MSIFQESFQPYVDLQLKIREAILKHGNTRSRFGSPNLIIGKGDKSKKVKIKQGSFYTNTVERQCTVRMASGVDIDGSSDTAKTFILEGGTTKKGGGQRDGFMHGNRKGNAYGSPEIFADAKDDFGIVPMPGIVDANIRTKSAYGSLREAQVNFVCHNRRQLEVLERLYMRPGFPLLVEWQWTPYVDNNGNIQKRVKSLSSNGGMFWNKTSTFNKMQDQIHKYKSQTGGNYDGFIGICKNFDFKATPAGGYECTTEIISTGEVIDGLKGKRDGYKIQTENDTEARELDNFEFFLEAIKQYTINIDQFEEISDMYVSNYEVKNPDSDKVWNTNVELFKHFQLLATTIAPESAQIFEALTVKQLEGIKKKEGEALVEEYREDNGKTIDPRDGKLGIRHTFHGRTDEGKKYESELKRIDSILNRFIIKKGETISVQADIEQVKVDDKEYGSPNTYVRWDFLANLINTHVLEEYKPKENISEINWTQKVKVPGFSEAYSYLDYTTTLTSPEVKIPLKQNEKGEGTNHFPLNNILGISLDPSKCLLPHQINQFLKGEYLADGARWNGDTIISKGDAATAGPYSIGFTYFSVEYLLKLYASMRYDSDGALNNNFKFLNFLKRLWEEDVNNSCAGTHNFLIHHDKENTSSIRVIDLLFQSGTKPDGLGLQPEDLYEFHIQDTNSIVRDFNFNSTIPSALSSTMAIVAQDPRSIGDVESVTANALNKNLTSRFSDFNNAYDFTEENIQARKDKEIDVIKTARKLFFYNANSLTGAYNKTEKQLSKGETNNPDYSSVQQAMKNYKQLNDLVEWLQTRYPLTNEKKEEFKIDDKIMAGALRKNIKITKSAIIPLQFQCLLDGIGGVIIGNVFRVDKKRLPKGYQGDDIAFIVHAESQTITSGQDWTTEISGQLVLLDIPQSEELMTGTIISPGDIAIKGSDLEGENSPTPNADMLRGALKHFGYREKDNFDYVEGIHAQISTFGDIGDEIRDAIVSILYKISNCFLKLPKEQRPIIMITGGNDRKSKTRHTLGNAIDFKIDKFYDLKQEKLVKLRPAFEEIYGTISEQKKIIHNKDFENADLQKLGGGISAEGNDFELNFEDNVTKRAIDNTIATIDSILKGFAGNASAEGRLRYLNEYNYPSKHATGPHFHVSVGPPNASEGGPGSFTNSSAPQNYTGRKQEGGLDNLTLAQKTVNEGNLVFYRDEFQPITGYDIRTLHGDFYSGHWLADENDTATSQGR